ncbi:Serine/threonine-protein kinase Sgk3 [Amphibalanus amphitrite]|uniref:Serine/threonine-protein kinase Sgk3 n=1 Tax=Amphibalanus amphitrite TaxID=1232801 RepID=A0A6A4WKH4_AMPAM|nr:Serine/threonine-protein kinase Sgk3 [Amphibalanus amphitrite]
MEVRRRSDDSGSEIEVDITDSETWDHKYTMYKLVIRRYSQSWFVYRRYSEFYRLNEQLKKLVAMESHKLPGKRMWGNLDPEFVRSRQLGLEEFARGLVTDERTRTLTIVQEFLQLHHRSSDSDENLTDDSAPSSGDETSDDDVRHIDPAFTREKVPSSVGRSTIGRSGSTLSQRSIDRYFIGFSYDPDCDLHDGD